VLYKKLPWSDGLINIFENVDDLEAKFYCFGGDGGSGSGGSNQQTDEAPEMSAYNETGRTPGQQMSQAQAESSMMSALSQANQNNQTDNAVNAFNTFVGSGYQTDDAPSNIGSGYGYSSISNTALAPSPQSPTTSPSPTDTVGFAIGPTTSVDTDNGIGSLGLSMNAPTTTEGVMSQATDIGFGSIPGTNTVGFNAPVGPGTIGIGTNLSGDIGLGYSLKFAKGGAVQKGIGGLMRRS
jgi:hypothetical protein